MIAPHQQIMTRCLQLARLGLGSTYPNPMVGAVIVNDGEIIGEGWHQKAGEPHAEALAIAQVKDKELLKTSTIYVSLEPCSHFGKTPPCADLIIQSKIPKVVIATLDPFAKVNGEGIRKLKSVGIQVEVGVLEKEAQLLNRRFFTFHQQKRPYVILKWAQTQNKMMSNSEPTQKWITNKFSKQLVHQWRTEEQAIMVGTQTARIDNPQLNVRLWTGNQPTRIVLDRKLTLSTELHLLDGTQPTIIFTEKKIENQLNLEYVQLNFDENLIPKLLTELYERNVQSIIIEGGKQLLESFINQNLWDEARIFTSQSEWAQGVLSPEIKGKFISHQKIKSDNLHIYSRL